VQGARAQIYPNYSVRFRQHIRRNRQADLLGSFRIDDVLKFGCSVKVLESRRIAVSSQKSFLFMPCVFTAMGMPQRRAD
jgi:hypothetical protein